MSNRNNNKTSLLKASPKKRLRQNRLKTVLPAKAMAKLTKKATEKLTKRGSYTLKQLTSEQLATVKEKRRPGILYESNNPITETRINNVAKKVSPKPSKSQSIASSVSSGFPDWDYSSHSSQESPSSYGKKRGIKRKKNKGNGKKSSKKK